MKSTYLTVREVADILRINVLTVYEYIKSGKVRALKLGRNYRIDVEEFNRFIKKNSV